MQKIDLKKLLFHPLVMDYRNAKENNKLTAQLNLGFDLMEASLKFLTILMLSVLKEEDEEKYKEVFTSFKAKTSLGNYYFLLLGCSNVTINSTLYIRLQELLVEEFVISIELEPASSILEGKRQRKKLSSLIQAKHNKPYFMNNLFLYALDFRNRIKGHSATFKEEDRLLSIRILKNMDLMLKHILEVVDKILILDGMLFYADAYLDGWASNANHKEHRFKKIMMKYEENTYCLSPMLAFISCNIYSCRKKHRTKVFFINEVSNSKSYYLDYLFNHNWRINTSGNEWKINTFQKDVKKLSEEIKLAYSNENKYTELISNFVGRTNELKTLKEYIFHHYDQNTISIVTGKPGIGKSSYVTKVQSLISEEKEDLITYLFYAIKNQNTDNELEKFIDALGLFLQKNKILKRSDLKNKEDDENQLTLMLNALSKSNKTLLLIIDGLDELNNAVAFLQSLPFSQFNHNSKLHIILTGRPYKSILKTLSSIFSHINTFNIFNVESVQTNGYSFALDSLSTSETKLLIEDLMPKEIDRETVAYKEVVSVIIDKSERLPIYIHYISQNLKDHEFSADEHYIDALTKWSKQLPKKLENYYIESFKDISSLSRKILIVMFYAPYGVSLEELYILLSPEHMDKIEFEQHCFTPIEMFLREIENDIFGFYHLSVKDAVFSYYIQRNEIIVFSEEKYIDSLIKGNSSMQLILKDTGYEEEITHLFSELYILNELGDFNKSVKSLIERFIIKRDDVRLKRFLVKNFFYIYYAYCSSLMISSVEDNVMSDKAFDIDKLRQGQNVKKEISKYFKLFDNDAPKDNTELITGAYKLSKMTGEVQKTLKYYELYMRANLETFMRICSDISNPAHIEEFKEKIIDWEINILPEQKYILIEMIIILNLSIPKSFKGVYELLEPKYQSMLIKVIK